MNSTDTVDNQLMAPRLDSLLQLRTTVGWNCVALPDSPCYSQRHSAEHPGRCPSTGPTELEYATFATQCHQA